MTHISLKGYEIHNTKMQSAGTKEEPIYAFLDESGRTISLTIGKSSTDALMDYLGGVSHKELNN